MFDTSAWETLRKTAEYKSFRKKNCRFAMIELLILSLFTGCIYFLHAIKSIIHISNFGQCILGLVCVLVMLEAFLKLQRVIFHPRLVFVATIKSIRIDKRRTPGTENAFEYFASAKHQYSVEVSGKEHWGTCVFDYLEKNENPHRIGEKVYFFSAGKNNNYILQSKICKN